MIKSCKLSQPVIKTIYQEKTSSSCSGEEPGSRCSRSKKPSFRQEYKPENRQEKKAYPVLPPFSCGIEKPGPCQNKGSKMLLSFCHMQTNCFLKRIEETQVLPVSCKKAHNMEQCVVFKKIFDGKLEGREILFQNEGAVSTYELPFPNHHNIKGKRSSTDGLLLQEEMSA